jgi:hypothetical protein
MDSCLRAVSKSGQQTDESLLSTFARSSAVAIVDRHARDVRNRDALVEAIARLALVGLEGQVRLYAAELREPRVQNSD